MSDFTFDPATLTAIAQAQATPRPVADGTPEHPYDLTGPANVICPVDAPLRNTISVRSASTLVTQPLASRYKIPGEQVEPPDEDSEARHLAECIMALKISEDYWIRQALIRMGVTNLDPAAVATHYALGESRGYYGTVEPLADGTLVYTVSHDVCLLAPEPILLCPLS